MLIHITWACYVHCQWSVDQCLPCSAASNIELRASINDSWLAYHQFPFQVSRNAAATTLDFGVGGFKGFSTSCKWWDISLDVPNTSPACRVTGVLRTFPLEVEEDQLMKEAPCRSMQMHEDVVHCSPDGLLPGGGPVSGARPATAAREGAHPSLPHRLHPPLHRLDVQSWRPQSAECFVWFLVLYLKAPWLSSVFTYWY